MEKPLMNRRQLLTGAVAAVLSSCQKTGEKRALPGIEFAETTVNNLSFTAIILDLRLAYLEVVDKPGGPDSSWQSAQEVVEAKSGLAAINGGFFTPEGAPLGLVETPAGSVGGVNRQTSLGNGFFLDIPPGIIPRRDLPKYQKKATHILQAGPLLIHNGEIPNLQRGDSSRLRSLLLSNGGTKMALMTSGPAALPDLAQALHQQPFQDKKLTIKHALNLDGGSSTDLWVAPALTGQAIQRGSLFRKPVRNYLLLKSIS